jgi:tripartite-type tricarboxylate transporter receptor subunit TctC
MKIMTNAWAQAYMFSFYLWLNPHLRPGVDNMSNLRRAPNEGISLLLRQLRDRLFFEVRRHRKIAVSGSLVPTFEPINSTASRVFSTIQNSFCRNKWTCAVFAYGFLSPLSVSHAQPSPNIGDRSVIRIVVPFSPGGPNDAIARLIAGPLSRQIGSPVVVENLSGGSGVVGANSVARAPANGKTLLLSGTSSLSILPAAKVAQVQDTRLQFESVALIGSAPNVLVVSNSLGANTLNDLISIIRADSLVTFSSSGIATTSYVAGEVFVKLWRDDAIHVPYRGGGEAIQAVVRGECLFSVAGLVAAAPLIRSGLLVPLAVTGPHRSSLFPEVPTFTEVGFSSVSISNWYAILAPKNTPSVIIEKLNADVRSVLESPVIRGNLKSIGVEIIFDGPPGELDGVLDAEKNKWENFFSGKK